METTRCPETTDGHHIWDTYEIPARIHFGDTETITTPGYTMRDCYACEENAQAPAPTG